MLHIHTTLLPVNVALDLWPVSDPKRPLRPFRFTDNLVSSCVSDAILFDLRTFTRGAGGCENMTANLSPAATK